MLHRAENFGEGKERGASKWGTPGGQGLSRVTQGGYGYSTSETLAVDKRHSRRTSRAITKGKASSF